MMMTSILFLLALAAGDPQVAPAASTSAKTEKSGDKMICKKFLETGSLVKGTRVCKTKADWDRDQENIRAGFNHAASCQTANGGSCF